MLSFVVLSLVFIPVGTGAVFGQELRGHACAFESSAYPSRYILHDVVGDDPDCVGLYTWERTTGSERQRSSFRVVPGLADSRYVSFESLDTPGYYISTKTCGALNLSLSRQSADTEFKKHATFEIVTALTGEAFPSISIESYYYPGKFIYDIGPGGPFGHILQIGSLGEDSDEQLRREATFVARSTLEYGKTVGLGFLSNNERSARYVRVENKVPLSCGYSQTPQFEWRFDLKPGTSGVTYPYVSVFDTFGIYNTAVGAYLVSNAHGYLSWASSSDASAFQWRIEGTGLFDKFRLWSLETGYALRKYLDDISVYPPLGLMTVGLTQSPAPSPCNMKYEGVPDSQQTLPDDPLNAHWSGQARLFARPEILIHGLNNDLAAVDWEGTSLFSQHWPGLDKDRDTLAVGNVDWDSAQELVWACHDSEDIWVFDMRDVRKHYYVEQAEIPYPQEGTGRPLLAVADLDGDGIDEIMFAQRGNGIAVYDSYSGTWWGRRLPLTYGEMGDRLAAGDVDGDGRAEVIYARCADDKLTIYDTDVDRATDLELPEELVLDFEYWDGLAVGDLNLDQIDEIVVASRNLNEFQIITAGGQVKRFGGQIDGWDVNIQYWDELAVGDVDHDGYGEIVLADRHVYRVRVFKVQGTSLGRGKGIDISDITQVTHFPWPFTWRNEGVRDFFLLADINSDSVVVGAPTGHQGTVESKTIAVIHAPPTHRGLNDKLGKYYAEFRTEDVNETHLTIKSIGSSVFTSEFTVEVGILFSSVKEKLTSKTEHRLTHESSDLQRTTQGRTTRASLYDRVIEVSTDYEVWEYPIIAPEELADINGAPQYCFVTVPLRPEEDANYLDPVVRRDDLFSYPQSYEELEDYEEANLIWSPVPRITVGPGYDHVWFTQEQTGETKKIRDSRVETGLEFDASGGPEKKGIFKLKMGHKLQGNYGNQTVTTHEIGFKHQEGIHVYWTGLKDDEEKEWNEGYLYKVRHVLYYRTDGALVLDYVVTDIGENLHPFGLKLPAGIPPIPFPPHLIGGNTLGGFVQALGLTALIAADSRMLPGGQVKVPIQVLNANNLATLDIEVSYDPTVLQAVGVEAGSLIPHIEPPVQPIERPLQYELQDGLVRLTVNTPAGINGDGAVAILVFDVIGADYDFSELDVQASATEAGTGEKVDLALRNGSFMADIQGNFNLDCCVDFVDFAALASAWLSMSGDANWDALCDIAEPRDNVIDARDLDAWITKWLADY